MSPALGPMKIVTASGLVVKKLFSEIFSKTSLAKKNQGDKIPVAERIWIVLSFSPEDIRKTLGFPAPGEKKNDVKKSPISSKHLILGYTIATVFITVVLSAVVYVVWNYGIAPFGVQKIGVMQSTALAFGLEALGILKK